MWHKRTGISLMIFLLIMTNQALAQTIHQYQGEIRGAAEEDEYPLQLQAGQGLIITAEAPSGSNLDTILRLKDSGGNLIAENDDYEYPRSTDSQIALIVQASGQFVVIVSNYSNTVGVYNLTIEITTAEEVEGVLSATQIDSTPQRESDLHFEGLLNNGEEALFPVYLAAGQGLVAAAYGTDETMNPILEIRDPHHTEIMINGDRNDYASRDSQIAFIAQESGEYTILVRYYPGYPGLYRLEVFFASEEEVLIAEQAMRLVLSGPIQTYASTNFVVHYTLEGQDATNEDMVRQVAETAEEAYAIQMSLGWAEPMRDNGQGGDNRFDIYLVDLRGDPYGYASYSSSLGDNPNTEIVESSATAGYMVLDNDYIEFFMPPRAMVATVAHVFNYLVQFAYDAEDLRWYAHSTASWMEIISFPTAEEATGYVRSVLPHPEICFGAQDSAASPRTMPYGHWLFMEFLSRELGEDIVIRLWENIAIYNSWEALEETLEDYNETVPNIVARYHINNLLRDYEFVDSFASEHVALEGTIDAVGLWTPSEHGAQQLGANYLEFTAEQGIYRLNITANYTPYELYGIGITGASAEVFDLGEEGIIDNHGYEHYYLMIFNTDMIDMPNSCLYTGYELEVESTTNRADTVWLTLNAAHFEAP